MYDGFKNQVNAPPHSKLCEDDLLFSERNNHLKSYIFQKKIFWANMCMF